MIETLAHGYSFESTLRELSTEYQHERVSMVLKTFSSVCLVLTLEGLKVESTGLT